MPIVAKETGSNFTPAPEGTHVAVCVDVVDLGLLEVNFNNQTKKQHKIRIVWQIAEDMENGKPFSVSKRYTLSLHEMAALRKDLESWRGRAFTPDELRGFDVETILGHGCMLNVIHAPNPKGGSPYANIKAIMKLPKGLPAMEQRDYIRVIDREPQAPNGEGESEPAPFGEHLSDDDVPF